MDYSSLDPSDIKSTCLLPTPSPLQAHSSIPQLLLSLSPGAGEQDITAIPQSSYGVSLIFPSPETSKAVIALNKLTNGRFSRYSVWKTCLYLTGCSRQIQLYYPATLLKRAAPQTGRWI